MYSYRKTFCSNPGTVIKKAQSRIFHLHFSSDFYYEITDEWP